MKIEINIPIEEFNKCDYDCDYDDYVESNDAQSFINVIIDRVAEKMFADICASDEHDINKMLSDKINHLKQTIENRMVKELSDEAYVEIRNKITDTVIENTVKRYERSRQYHDIKNQLELKSDSAISAGIKELISDIVKTEIKKMIKL